MKLDGQGIYYLLDDSGKDKERVELTDKEKQELTAIAVSEIKDMLQDIYNSMYPEEK